jgi:hypothetical protein
MLKNLHRAEQGSADVAPPNIPNEPPSDPPYLNPTANWFSGDAWFLFQEIVQRCGLPTAKFIFQKCINVADEKEDQARALEKAKAARRDRAPIKLPTIEQIDAADRHQISVWWARLRGTDQDFSADQERKIQHLAGRYREVDGYTKDFDETKLPPIPKERNQADAALLAMFDRSDPQSAYSIACKKHGSELNIEEFAATLVPTHGTSAKHVLRKLKYQRTGH